MEPKKSIPSKIKESYYKGWQIALMNQDFIDIEAIKQLVIIPHDQPKEGFSIINSKGNITLQ